MPRPEDEYDDLNRPDRDDRERPPPRRKSNTAVIITVVVLVCLCMCSIPVCIGLLLPAVQKIRESANRVKSSNNEKQIGIAIHTYHDTHGDLPANTYSPDGKPLLSWRVHILPFIEQDQLYQQFNLDEPWDSPNNIRLLNQMPRVYVSPQSGTVPGLTRTHYRGFSSPGAVFERKRVVRVAVGKDAPAVRPEDRFTLGRFKDQTSETILVVEARDAVEWTKPDDLDASPGKPFPALAGPWGRGNRVNVLFADGTVKTLPTDLPESTWRALVTHSGGEVLPPGWDAEK